MVIILRPVDMKNNFIIIITGIIIMIIIIYIILYHMFIISYLSQVVHDFFH